MSRLFITFISIFTPSLALAHSGHGFVDATSVWHWLLEVDHIGWLVPAAVILFVLIRSGLLSKR